MSHTDANRWDCRYSDDSEFWMERAPRQLLRDHAHQLPTRGLALDAASGVSASGLFLAEHGLHVIALDISLVALRMAVRQAHSLSLPLEAAVCDLSNPWLPPETFDVIVNFKFLERATFPVYRQALKPGGLILFETFLKIDSDLTKPDYYLEPGELLRNFQDYEIIQWGEKKVPPSHAHPERGVAQLVARKA